MSNIEKLYLILKSNGVSVAEFIKYLDDHDKEIKELLKNKKN
jgi:hypothetical protein